MNIFPTFLHYIATSVLCVVLILVTIGYFHFKRSAAFRSDVIITTEANPFDRRSLINSEINLELNLTILNLLSKLSNGEKLNPDEVNKIQESRNIIDDFINKRSIKNNKDLEYLKKLLNE